MSAYYNEYDQKAAAWLRELIKADLIAPGEVDERSIADVKADDLRGFTQCHFFAGIGGWSYALRLAGWPDDRPVWTGSPPCQPFSNAGKRKGQDDLRHLWPVFFNLVSKCKPANIFGEQVEAAIRTGWLDDLQDDLEAENYATGKIVLPACGLGAPHIRQRIWFVAELLADSDNERSQGRAGMPSADELAAGAGSLAGRLADTNEQQRNRSRGAGEAGRGEFANIGTGCGLADTTGDRCERQGQRWPAEEGREQEPGTDWELPQGFERSSDNGGLAESDSARRKPGQRHNQAAGYRDTVASESCDDRPRPTDAPETFWGNPDWLFCRDGKWRPVESSVLGIFNGLPDELVRSCNISPACNPLAKDQEARTMRLKGYGNAIVPPLAAEFIKAYLSMKAWEAKQ